MLRRAIRFRGRGRASRPIGSTSPASTPRSGITRRRSVSPWGAAGLETEELLGPVLDAFAIALPHNYDPVTAAPGAAVMIAIDGPVLRSWRLERAAESWIMRGAESSKSGRSGADVEIEVDAHVAWRLLTNSIDRHEARKSASIRGPDALAARFFDMVTVMAPSAGPPAP